MKRSFKLTYIALFTTLIAIFLITACMGSRQTSKIVVASPPQRLDIPLSSVVFRKVDARGDPLDIILELNAAMKEAGFPLGLTPGGTGQRGTRKAHVKLENVTLRQVVDEICVQAGISYWDNLRLRELYLCPGPTIAFDAVRGIKDGLQPATGPAQFRPPGMASGPTRPTYFDRTIEDLARERLLIP